MDKSSSLFRRARGWVGSVVAFGPDGKKIVSSSTDGKIRMRDIESGTCVDISPTMAGFMGSATLPIKPATLQVYYSPALGTESYPGRWMASFEFGIIFSRRNRCTKSTDIPLKCRSWNQSKRDTGVFRIVGRN